MARSKSYSIRNNCFITYTKKTEDEKEVEWPAFGC